jgi:hypothetical protein
MRAAATEYIFNRERIGGAQRASSQAKYRLLKTRISLCVTRSKDLFTPRIVGRNEAT